jgi:spore germination cell wall hydrolase CwlJ-like protein
MFGLFHGRVIALFTLFFGLALPGAGYGESSGRIDSFGYTEIKYGQELGCLALNIYHEGRGEPTRGQAAIAAVTMNRVRSNHYPGTVCDVVWQYKQFSWTLAPSSDHGISDPRAWKQALVIARLFVDGAISADVGEATHYHTNDVSPYWIADNKPLTRVGKHTFYIL